MLSARSCRPALLAVLCENDQPKDFTLLCLTDGNNMAAKEVTGKSVGYNTSTYKHTRVSVFTTSAPA